MEQCYSTVQGKKTSVYDRKQYDQLFTAFPKKLRRLWDIERGQVLEWHLNENDEMTVKKVKAKPTHNSMKYEDWLTKIKPNIPIEPPGKTYEEICKETGILSKAASAIWVNRAKNDIGLNNHGRDSEHRTLWFRTAQISIQPPTRVQLAKNQEQKEAKVRIATLREFQETT
jgi:bifunctional DNA-binding transcriptional regulator/antitoxin component of YhaV-PrlF toxin-antitoxin module